MEALTLDQVRRHNRKWFGDGNAKFFGDLEYYVMHSDDGTPYLVRLTTAWSDMFGGKKVRHYRINYIEGLTIGSLIDDEFKTMEDVEDWLLLN